MLACSIWNKKVTFFLYVEDGCTYYDGTLKGEDSLQKLKKSEWIDLFTAGASLFPAIVQLVSLIGH